MSNLPAILIAAAALAPLGAGAMELVVNPALPAYGQPVTVELRDASSYLPASRYTRSGSTIIVEFEYAGSSFGPFGQDFGTASLPLGELAPGNYTLHARLFNMASPKSAPEVMTRQIAVVPPGSWGLHLVPAEPDAFAPFEVVVRSAVYFDPSSMRARVDGGVVRIDFDYQGDAPAGGSAPSGMTTFAAVRIGALPPGAYRIEGWGRDRTSGATERYFEKQVGVAPTVPVVEYYSFSLDHYFIAAGAEEIALVDGGGRGDWKRTGQQFKAWMRASDAPPAARPVCRFYAAGPNSHFYTGDPAECDYLRKLEASQRADANARGQPFLGWQYEGIAFHSVLPDANGACPGGMLPVHRAYNNRARENDSNHRFMADARQRAAMSVSWTLEGVALCSAP
jgi:hypothetical protein